MNYSGWAWITSICDILRYASIYVSIESTCWALAHWPAAALLTTAVTRRRWRSRRGMASWKNGPSLSKMPWDCGRTNQQQELSEDLGESGVKIVPSTSRVEKPAACSIISFTVLFIISPAFFPTFLRHKINIWTATAHRATAPCQRRRWLSRPWRPSEGRSAADPCAGGR